MSLIVIYLPILVLSIVALAFIVVVVGPYILTGLLSGGLVCYSFARALVGPASSPDVRFTDEQVEKLRKVERIVEDHSSDWSE